MARTAVVALLSGAPMAAARIALTDCDPERGKVVDGQCLLWDAPGELAADVISFACPSAARRRFSGEISVQDRKLIGALGLQSAKAVSLCAEMLELNWMSVELIASALIQEMVRHRPALMPPIQFLPVSF